MRPLPTFLRHACILALSACTLLPHSPASAQETTQNTLLAAALPNAPSTLLAATLASEAEPPPSPGPPPTGAVIVNGRPYRKPTRREDFNAYRHDMIGPRPFIGAAIRSGIEQARDVPIGWGQDFPGYIQRYGSAYGEAAIDTSVRYGMAAALHEDVRYLICHACSAGEKFANAFLYEFTARHGDDGVRSFSPTPIVATFSGPLVAYAAWYPPGYTSEMALKHATLGFSTRILFNIVREFAFDRDNSLDKALQAKVAQEKAAQEKATQAPASSPTTAP